MAVMRRIPRPAVLAGVALMATVLLMVVGAGSAAAQDAESLYIANCSQCHQADGSGTPPLFPPLAGNPNVGDAAYVAGVIRNGREGEIEVLGVTYDGQMPAFAALSDAEIDAIVGYVQTVLQEVDEPAATTTLPPLDEPIEGVAFEEAAAAGRRLFGGWEGLENGGPACLACHTAGDLGNLSGPGLGPDLTNAFAAYGGQQGLRAALAGPHDDVMAELYGDDPLTPMEVAELTAFLQSESTDRGGAFVDGLWVLGLAGLLLLVGFVAMVGFGGRKEEPA